MNGWWRTPSILIVLKWPTQMPKEEGLGRK